MKFFAFDVFKRTHTLQHLVEVYLMSVELWSVNAYKTSLSAYSDTASTAHTCTVYHDGVKRYIGRDFIFLSKQTYEFHHDSWTDSKAFVYLFALDDIFYTFCYQSFTAIRTVVGHDNHFVRAFAHFFFEDDKLFRTSGEHRDNAVSGSLQCLHDRQHRSYAYTTSGTNYGTEILNVSGFTQRTYHVGYIIAFFQFAKACRRKSYFLHYQSNGSLYRVGFGYGKRHTLSLFAYTYDNKVSGFS